MKPLFSTCKRNRQRKAFMQQRMQAGVEHLFKLQSLIYDEQQSSEIWDYRFCKNVAISGTIVQMEVQDFELA
jgi:hypothetical protein